MAEVVVVERAVVEAAAAELVLVVDAAELLDVVFSVSFLSSSSSAARPNI